MKNKQIIERVEKIILKVLREKVEFGEFGKDALSWRAANFIYDSGYSGVYLGNLFNYLNRESSGKMTDGKFSTIVKKLTKAGEYIIDQNSADKWKSKIYHKAYKK